MLRGKGRDIEGEETKEEGKEGGATVYCIASGKGMHTRARHIMCWLEALLASWRAHLYRGAPHEGQDRPNRDE